MSNKNLAIITFFLFFFVMIALIFFFLRERESVFVPMQDRIIQNNPKKDERWLEEMAHNKNSDYSYPTNEMVLKYNFHRGVEPLRIFIRDLNEYRFYCINQILIENKIEYAYYKTSSVIQLVIFLNNEKIQKKILEDFKYYNIQYSPYASK